MITIRLNVTAAQGNERAHLRVFDPPNVAAWTLCAQVAELENQYPQAMFQESGCRTCADVAVRSGYRAAEDRQGATVNLRRWRACQDLAAV